MTMTFSLHESLEFGGIESRLDSGFSTHNHHHSDELHLLAEKLKLPKTSKHIERPRLDEILSKSVEKFGTILITGRAGTGKTALAVDFARNYRKSSWFRIDSADADWKTFSRYFAASIENLPNCSKSPVKKSKRNDVSLFVEDKIAEIKIAKNSKPLLLVLDDVHHIFDAVWFEEFFLTLVYSLPAKVHLLLLSRGTPALPLWRLRSKQVLGVIDEKLLAFNLKETTQFFDKYCPSSENAPLAFSKSFGRISRLKRFVETV